ncbi:MAG: hypothetical protein CVT48_03675 [Thermoplasmata archaeon HGW-Thermoplasmata-1]|nr:MAG: hypothetical protein CVT48_03675 [Thermoplasmata archaeon HGW-Thermoplasmata-1]
MNFPRLACAILVSLVFVLPAAAAARCLELGDGVGGEGTVWVDGDYEALVTGRTEGRMYGNTVVLAVAREDTVLRFGSGVNLAASHVSMNISVEDWSEPALREEHPPETRIREIPSGASFELFCEEGSKILLYGKQMCSVDLTLGEEGRAGISFCPAGTDLRPMEPEGYDLGAALPGRWHVADDLTPASAHSPEMGFDGSYRMIICGPEAVVPSLSESLFTGVWESREKGFWYDQATGGWLGPGSHRVVHVDYIEVEVEYSSFLMAFEGFEVTAYADRADYWVNGSLYVPRADGGFDIEGETIEINDEELRVSGYFLLQPKSGDEGVELHASNEFTSIWTPSLSREYTAAALTLAAIATAVLTGAAWALRRGIFSIPLWSRITNGNTLDFENRRTIYELLKKNPGLSQSEVQKIIGVGWGTVRHHLAVLEREGYIKFAVCSRKKKCFPCDIPPAERKRMCVLSDTANRDIVEIIRGNLGITQSGIVAATEFSQSTISCHLRELESAGIVRRERKGRWSHFYPAAESAAEPGKN